MPLSRYVVLPAFGFRSEALAVAGKQAFTNSVMRLEARRGTPSGRPPDSTTVQVLDSVGENEPKLVEMTSEAELNLRATLPYLKIVPVVTYQKMRMVQEVLKPSSAGIVVSSTRIKISDSISGRGIAGAKIMAFTDFRNRAGAEAMTDANGVADIALKSGTKVERLYVYGPPRYWGNFQKAATLSNPMAIALRPVDPAWAMLLQRQFYGDLPPDVGAGVRVGVVDTGVDGAHPCLSNVSGGVNLVFDEVGADPEQALAWGPAIQDGEHGTHVAGIIGARPSPGLQLRGIAPGVELRSYRVFPNNGDGATNYDIMNAIRRAVADGCHIINLSLGGGSEDEAVRAAIGDAADAGVLVVAAAGNDGRKPVSYPAALDVCVAVSAMGRADAFPPESTESADISKPFGSSNGDFVAAFSNAGPQIDFTGPGCGIVSTLPAGAYGPMSGTSMACPAIAGFAAYLLASNPEVLNTKGAERSRLLKSLLYSRSAVRGFGRDFEGFGLPL